MTLYPRLTHKRPVQVAVMTQEGVRLDLVAAAHDNIVARPNLLPIILCYPTSSTQSNLRPAPSTIGAGRPGAKVLPDYTTMYYHTDVRPAYAYEIEKWYVPVSLRAASATTAYGGGEDFNASGPVEVYNILGRKRRIDGWVAVDDLMRAAEPNATVPVGTAIHDSPRQGSPYYNTERSRVYVVAKGEPGSKAAAGYKAVARSYEKGGVFYKSLHLPLVGFFAKPDGYIKSQYITQR